MKANRMDAGAFQPKIVKGSGQFLGVLMHERILFMRTQRDLQIDRLLLHIPSWAWYQLGYAIESQNRGGKP
jgi:hypothetical protein